MSPGGAEEVSRVLEGLDLTGMTTLDIGCGTGAITLSLVKDHGAARSVGIDVESVVCEKARARADKAGAAKQVEIVEVVPGPLPFADESFDLVFSKDSIIHIQDKEALAREVYRVLKPGGIFAASDWLSSHDDPPTPEMQLYLDLEGLGFTMASAERWEKALNEAGFADVATKNRNPWYREVAKQELETLSGARRKEFEEKCGADLVAQNVAVWEAMVHVLNTGELCPHHLRARKPA
jgi:phosphoethanolamine N-methyltransferase